MTEFMLVQNPPQEDDEEFELPHYKERGWILVEITFVYPRGLEPFSWKYYEIENVAYHTGASTFWIREGGGLDDWVQDHIDVEQPGWYVIEGITGSTHKDYWGEVDEDWDFESVRYAFEDEIVMMQARDPGWDHRIVRPRPKAPRKWLRRLIFWSIYMLALILVGSYSEHWKDEHHYTTEMRAAFHAGTLFMMLTFLGLYTALGIRDWWRDAPPLSVRKKRLSEWYVTVVKRDGRYHVLGIPKFESSSDRENDAWRIAWAARGLLFDK